MPKRRLFVLILIFCATFILVVGVSAAPLHQDDPPAPDADGQQQLSISDEHCLSCHGQPGETMTLEDGSQFELYVPGVFYYESVHGEAGYACVQDCMSCCT